MSEMDPMEQYLNLGAGGEPPEEGEPRTFDTSPAHEESQPEADEEAVRRFLLSDPGPEDSEPDYDAEDGEDASDESVESQETYSGEVQIRTGEHRELDNAMQIEGGEYYTEDDRLLAGEDRRGDQPLPTMTAEIRQAWHERLDEELEKVNQGEVNGVRFSAWEANVGGGDIRTLHAAKLMLSSQGMPRMEPEWPVVQRGTLRLEPVPKKAGRPIEETRLKKAMIIPDTQIPYHDPYAMAVALQATVDQEPDLVVFLGDYLDWPQQSRYDQMPEFARISQLGVDIGTRVLELYRQRLPDTEMVLLEGNHDMRIWNDLIKNSMGSFGLKRGNAPPEEWPVNTVPHLLRMNDLGIHYIDGYPNNEFWINPNLVCIHGVKSVSRGSTARAVWNNSNVSAIFGHIHKVETLYEDDEDFYGSFRKFSHSPGGLCLTDGVVPNGRNTRDLRSSAPIRKQQRWQHGFSRVLYEPAPRTGKPDRNKIYEHHLDSFEIATHHDYRTRVGDEFYKPNKKLVRQLTPTSYDSHRGTIFAMEPSQAPPRKRISVA